MIYIKQIMDLLDVDETVARRVFDSMDIHFSNSSKAQINREAKLTYAGLMAAGVLS